MNDMQTAVVYGVIAVNACIALIYLIYGFLRVKDERKKYAMISFLIFFTPPVGCIVFVFAHALYRILFGQDIDRDAVSFSKERVKIYTLPDEEKELNIVPVNETLSISDKTMQRNLILNVLKDYSQHSLATISDALKSKDSEVSHYAASALMDAIADFRATAQNLLFAIQKNDEDMEIKIMCFQYISVALQKKFLPEIEYRSYVYALQGVLKDMFDQDQIKVPPEYYETMVYFLLQFKDFTTAHIWSEQLALYHKYTLSYYKTMMKLSYAEHNYSLFFKTMEQLKASEVNIDGETLDLIRTFER